ncbi:tRNA lysidine(34) synthetase TilS [Mycoplasmopsis felis]|uniref:tRNA lysidine(34) synthetase TilS n=1 Tax=Mycoplasmopsis felis TaxID=33923 RepID=UPI002AFE5B47|nr:tRNA lysidine(34) synthetase TilS [Mycoplasmopsis felis]WQQ10083.1 tRNA lysidine(34) synthetase TilS [Mycoplasmopsis felis]
MEKNKKYLIAVSGGPDSMFLLDKYKNKNIIVAYVNYNQRKDSHIDTNIVKEYCKKNNIPLEIMELKKEDYTFKNFQNWAREQRYLFFKKIYYENHCDYLLIAHHLDDFIETAQMQLQSQRNQFYYGIKKTNKVYDMLVYRPFLFKYFKSTILNKCIKKLIPYAIDYTNEKEVYTRNKIRKENQKKNKLKKILFLFYILLKNKKRKRIFNLVLKEYKIWKESKFSQDLFNFFNFKNELIFMMINNNFVNVNLTKDKINSIISFIVSKNRTSKYKLDEKNYLIKNKGQVFVFN